MFTIHLNLFDLKDFSGVWNLRGLRTGVPKTKGNTLDKRSPMGSIHWTRDGDLLNIKWKDTCKVSVCVCIHLVYSGDMLEQISYTCVLPVDVKRYQVCWTSSGCWIFCPVHFLLKSLPKGAGMYTFFYNGSVEWTLIKIDWHKYSN